MELKKYQVRTLKILAKFMNAAVTFKRRRQNFNRYTSNKNSGRKFFGARISVRVVAGAVK